MKEQTKNLFLKALLMSIKVMCIAPVIFFLIYEAYVTQNEEAYMAHVQYVAIITTLCWGLILWMFFSYKLKHYLVVFLVLVAFLYMFFFDLYIKRAHQLDTCVDRGLVWDYDQHICRNDCLSWNSIQKCIPL